MTHDFQDLYISTEKQFSVGIDRATGRHFISFLRVTADRRSEFEVYFELPEGYGEPTSNDPEKLERFVNQCRQGLHADLQISP